jgi:hypothetical protein
VIGDVVMRMGGTAGPRFNVPKYFSTSLSVFALSMSPTMERLALLGV